MYTVHVLYRILCALLLVELYISPSQQLAVMSGHFPAEEHNIVPLMRLEPGEGLLDHKPSTLPLSQCPLYIMKIFCHWALYDMLH